MIPVSSIIKWVIVGGIFTILAVSVKKGYDYHLDQIDKAVNSAKLEFAVEKQEALTNREKVLRQESKNDKEKIENELRVERRKVSDLERMLLIDHDLDRLLQRKPGLILPRVNKGTQEILLELKETTQ